MSDLTNQSYTMEQLLEEVASLKEENTSLKGDLSQLKDENNELKRDNTALKAKNQTLNDEIYSLKSQHKQSHTSSSHTSSKLPSSSSSSVSTSVNYSAVHSHKRKHDDNDAVLCKFTDKINKLSMHNISPPKRYAIHLLSSIVSKYQDVDMAAYCLHSVLDASISDERKAIVLAEFKREYVDGGVGFRLSDRDHSSVLRSSKSAKTK